MKVHADINGLSFAAMQGMMLHEATEHGLPVLEQSEDWLKIGSEYGAFSILDLGESGLRLGVEAETRENLHVLRDSLVGHIEHFLPEVAATIRWSDAIDAGKLPPNLQFCELLAKTQISTDFIRLQLRLSKPELFDDKSIHFRFVLPHPDDDNPEWPTLAANGSTRWPQGDKALHRPVYTARRQLGDVIDVDIFCHEGGQTTGWAKAVEVGSEVTLIGPGGSGLLNEQRVLLAGDETGYPAIARMLEGLPEDSAGEVILLSSTGTQDYPIPQVPGVDVQWVEAATFVATVAAAAERLGGGYLWVAAEAEPIKALRQLKAISSIPKARRYLGAYWTRGVSL